MVSEESVSHGICSFAATYASVGGDVVDLGDCTLVRSRVSFPPYGGVFLPRLGAAGLEKRLLEIRAEANARGIVPSWFVGSQAEPRGLSETMRAMGAAELVNLTCLYGGSDQLVHSPDVAGVEVRGCENDSEVEQYARLYPLLFDSPLDDWIESLVDAELALFRSPHDPFRRWLAWEDGRPVCAGMVMREGGMAVLETLCSLPECRNRGIGAALMARALEELIAEGCTSMGVCAGPGAEKLYARMGFEEVGKVAILMWPY